MTTWDEAQRELLDRAFAEWRSLLQRCGKPTELETATPDEIISLARQDRVLSAHCSRDGYGSGSFTLGRVDPDGPPKWLKPSSGSNWWNYFLVFPTALSLTDEQVRLINQNYWEGWGDFQRSMHGL